MVRVDSRKVGNYCRLIDFCNVGDRCSGVDVRNIGNYGGGVDVRMVGSDIGGFMPVALETVVAVRLEVGGGFGWWV